MNRLLLAVSLLALVLGHSSTVRAEMIIGGIGFDERAFADEVVSAVPDGSGHFARETSPPSGVLDLDLPTEMPLLEAAVLGSDLTQWVSLRSDAARLTLGFTDLIPIDGPGADIAIIETGSPAPLLVTIAGVSQPYTSQDAGGVNLVLLDLQSFGVSTASELTIASRSILNDIAAVGAIHFAVPEPAGIVLLGIAGVCGLFSRRVRRRLRLLS